MAINKSFNFKNWNEITSPREALHAQDLFNIIGLSRGFGIKSGCSISRTTNTITIADGVVSIDGNDVNFTEDSVIIDDTGMSSGEYRWTIIYITPAGAIGKTDGTANSIGNVIAKPTDKTNLVICAALKTHGTDLVDEDIQPMAINLTGHQSILDNYLSEGTGITYSAGLISIDGTIVLQHSDVDDIAVDGATNVPISSNWAFDHNANASAHHTKYSNSDVDAHLSGGTMIDYSSGVISHADTSSQGSVNNSNGTVIQDITLDSRGHITDIGSTNLDSRYYTESESDARFINDFDAGQTIQDFAGGEATFFTFYNTTNSDSNNVKGVNIRHDGTSRNTGDVFLSFRDGDNTQLGYVHSSVVYATFTGGHESQSLVFDKHKWRKGWIVSSTGVIDEPRDISRALPYIEVSTKRKDKRVIGVYSGWLKGHRGRECTLNIEREIKLENGKTKIVDDCHSHHSKGWDADLDLITYNSLGEGMVLVTDINGEPQNGDYIQSSDYMGIGEKQDDDILHSYTVAKLTENINWSKVEIDEEYGIKIVLVGCTYHCG